MQSKLGPSCKRVRVMVPWVCVRNATSWHATIISVLPVSAIFFRKNGVLTDYCWHVRVVLVSKTDVLNYTDFSKFRKKSCYDILLKRKKIHAVHCCCLTLLLLAYTVWFHITWVFRVELFIKLQSVFRGATCWGAISRGSRRQRACGYRTASRVTAVSYLLHKLLVLQKILISLVIFRKSPVMVGLNWILILLLLDCEIDFHNNDTLTESYSLVASNIEWFVASNIEWFAWLYLFLVFTYFMYLWGKVRLCLAIMTSAIP